MKQFNLAEWIKDKSRKVVTRDGKPVRIVYTDSPILHHPIVGFVECDLFTWTDDGKVIYDGKCEDKNDLFFADEEVIKSPFIKELEEHLKNTPKEQIEKDWKEIQDWYNQHWANKSNDEYGFTEFEKIVQNILNELHFQDVQAVKQFSKTLLDLARKEILKDLPKWKKAKKDEELDCHVAIQQDDRVVLSDFVQKDEYYITLNVLKKLQKEE